MAGEDNAATGYPPAPGIVLRVEDGSAARACYLRGMANVLLGGPDTVIVGVTLVNLYVDTNPPIADGLAALDPLLALSPSDRNDAIAEIVSLLHWKWSEGAPLDRMLEHAERAQSVGLEDEDELADELLGLLHASAYSNEFGFDTLAWLSHAAGEPARAFFVEVKSSPANSFHFSRGERGLAAEMSDAGMGSHYAVLVVRRSVVGGPPSQMDMLVDPEYLIRIHRLSLDPDGYVASY